MTRLPEAEQRAATAIDDALGAVVELDGIGDAPTPRRARRDPRGRPRRAQAPRRPVRRRRVRRADLGRALARRHRTSSCSGLSEDLYPGRHRIDPLLSEAVRVATGGALPTSRDRLRSEHRAVLAAFAAGDHVVASFPRGDLRRGAERLPSRWLMPTLRALAGQPELEATRWAEASAPQLRSVASHWEGIARADRPGTEQEWRLRHARRRRRLVDDDALDGALELIDARRADGFTRFDGNLDGVDGPARLRRRRRAHLADRAGEVRRRARTRSSSSGC